MRWGWCAQVLVCCGVSCNNLGVWPWQQMQLIGKRGHGEDLDSGRCQEEVFVGVGCLGSIPICLPFKQYQNDPCSLLCKTK